MTARRLGSNSHTLGAGPVTLPEAQHPTASSSGQPGDLVVGIFVSCPSHTTRGRRTVFLKTRVAQERRSQRCWPQAPLPAPPGVQAGHAGRWPPLHSPHLVSVSPPCPLFSATCFLYPGCFPESVFVLCVTDTQPESPRSGREVSWFPTTFLVAGRSSDQLRAWALSSRSFSFLFSHFLTKNGLCVTVLVASLIGMKRRGRCSRGTRPPPPFHTLIPHLHLPFRSLLSCPEARRSGPRRRETPACPSLWRFTESGQVGSEVLSPSFLLPVPNVCFPGEEFRYVSNLTALSGLLIILTFVGSFRRSSC